jgi:predicted nucleic-acid-binding protein
MIAVDTNVLVRLLTNDDPAQAKRAMQRMRSDTVWISRTVLLETEWVLRHAYGLSAAAIGKALSMTLGTASVDVEDRTIVLRALSWHSAGMDFADALHLASSDSAASFVSFDRSLARTAKRLGATPQVVAP